MVKCERIWSSVDGQWFTVTSTQDNVWYIVTDNHVRRYRILSTATKPYGSQRMVDFSIWNC